MHEVPQDFASFVASHERHLRATCADLTGDGPLARVLCLDLLATVALRWRLRPHRWRDRLSTAYLHRLLIREVRAWRAPPSTVAGRIRVVDGTSPGVPAASLRLDAGTPEAVPSTTRIRPATLDGGARQARTSRISRRRR